MLKDNKTIKMNQKKKSYRKHCNHAICKIKLTYIFIFKISFKLIYYIFKLNLYIPFIIIK
jgi:hypothetical protein